MIQKEFAHRMIDQLFEIRETMQAKLIPKEANQHFQKAKKEGLLGIQAMLSHLIQEMDKDEQKQPRSSQVQKITIDE